MRRRPGLSAGPRGFSMVELLVALVFTSILMAGLASVFKSSITTFYTAGEKLSSARRNRVSLDLLYDDLNTIGLYLDLIHGPQGVGPANPPFYVLPNQVVNPSASPVTYADQVFFYVDQPFAFSAQISSFNSGGVVAGTSASQNTMISTGTALSSYDSGLTLDCGSLVYANQVYAAFASGQQVMMILQDNYGTPLPVTSVTKPTDNYLKVQTGASANAGITGVGPIAGPSTATHIVKASVTFYIPAQMIRYSVQLLQLDPAAAASGGVPCLVRDQGNYSPGGFVAAAGTQQVIAENVTGFKIYLSANPGYLTSTNPTQAWAPFSTIPSPATFDSGWTNGILADLNTQLAASGRTGQTSTGTSTLWFRDIPVVVRVDVTTQTATQRAEYSTTGTTLAAKTLTRSLIMVPRNFGLPLS